MGPVWRTRMARSKPKRSKYQANVHIKNPACSESQQLASIDVSLSCPTVADTRQSLAHRHIPRPRGITLKVNLLGWSATNGCEDLAETGDCEASPHSKCFGVLKLALADVMRAISARKWLSCTYYHQDTAIAHLFLKDQCS
jgi:hypothetical protein